MLLIFFKSSCSDLLHYGLLMLAQKSASQYGDGEGALAFWKNSIADYHDEKKVLKLNFNVLLTRTIVLA